MTEIYLHIYTYILCAYGRLYPHAPVLLLIVVVDAVVAGWKYRFFCTEDTYGWLTLAHDPSAAASPE